MADKLRVLAAGSLRNAFPAIIEAFQRQTCATITLTLGPAGLLRERIEGGEDFDIYASANMAHPRELVRQGLARDVTCFAENRFCIIARPDIGLSKETFIDRLAHPDIRIGISTPGDDPSGDYAFEVFDRMEAQRPGMGDMLKQRALQLVGGRHSPPPPAGKGPGYLICDGAADVTMGYSSNAQPLRGDPRFSVLDIPPPFAPLIEYGVAVAMDAGPIADALKAYILAEPGRDVLIRSGFLAPQVANA